MQLTSSSFNDGDPIPGEYAFCVPDAPAHATFGLNRNPHLAWSEAPEGTLSFALICSDDDAPTVPDDVNQDGREVPVDLPRGVFFHWVAVDIPSDRNEIEAGEFSEGVVPHGKPSGVAAGGIRQGSNDYTGWFEGDPAMEGTYHGYDGPCPPWNDARIHRYTFTVYALALDHCRVDASFTGHELREALHGHVLATASLTCTYTLNPRLIR
jgi:Raf kinase inhibitor-like YbhB/YbcL family protein